MRTCTAEFLERFVDESDCGDVLCFYVESIHALYGENLYFVKIKVLLLTLLVKRILKKCLISF